VWVVYRTGCELGGARTGLAAGLLPALNPLLVWYSQEARAYAFLALWGGLSFYLAIRQPADESAARSQRWCWAVVAVLALCTHYFAIFFLVPEAVWPVARARRPPWLQLGLVTVVGLALLPLAIEQRSLGHTDWINGTPLRTRAALIPKQFVTGLSAPHRTALAFCALAAIAIGLIALAKSRLAAPPEALLAGGSSSEHPSSWFCWPPQGSTSYSRETRSEFFRSDCWPWQLGSSGFSETMPPQVTALLVGADRGGGLRYCERRFQRCLPAAGLARRRPCAHGGSRHSTPHLCSRPRPSSPSASMCRSDGSAGIVGSGSARSTYCSSSSPPKVAALARRWRRFHTGSGHRARRLGPTCISPGTLRHGRAWSPATRRAPRASCSPGDELNAPYDTVIPNDCCA
jgi:hypothetical protein